MTIGPRSVPGTADFWSDTALSAVEVLQQNNEPCRYARHFQAANRRLVQVPVPAQPDSRAFGPLLWIRLRPASPTPTTVLVLLVDHVVLAVFVFVSLSNSFFQTTVQSMTD